MSINEKHNRRPLLDPLLLILKSRRVLIALVALAVHLLVYAVPSLAPLQADLLPLLTVLALALIGGYTLEDAAAARASLPPVDTTTRQHVIRVVDALFDTLQSTDAPPDTDDPAE